MNMVSFMNFSCVFIVSGGCLFFFYILAFAVT